MSSKTKTPQRQLKRSESGPQGKEAHQRRVCLVLLGMVLPGVVLLFTHSAFALDPALDLSQYAHTAWKVRDGFTKSAINALAQTPDGYLWLGTELGLVRFDGVRAVPWQPPKHQR
jgi:ligand-binding sensor domain-containing protein